MIVCMRICIFVLLGLLGFAVGRWHTYKIASIVLSVILDFHDIVPDAEELEGAKKIAKDYMRWRL